MPRIKISNPWDAARSLPCVRGNHHDPPAPLEPGVKFFVLMLEQLGCTPLFSCEGHPAGFYIAFTGPERVARKIAAAGFFALEISNLGWRISLDRAQLLAGAAWSLRRRDQILRQASESWEELFGKLDGEKRPLVSVPREDELEAAIRALIVAGHTVIDFCDDPDEDVREGSLFLLEEAVSDTEIALAMRLADNAVAV
jgi:hypothetical protein